MNLKSLVTLNEEACLRGSEVSRREFSADEPSIPLSARGST